MQVSIFIRRLALASIVAIAAVLFATGANAQLGAVSPGTESDDPSLGAIPPSFTYTNAAHVANGASLRDSGKATIRLRGMPGDAKVIKAWLYWDFTSLTSPTFAQSRVLFGRTDGWFFQPFFEFFTLYPLYGTQIGSGADPCWFGGNNFAFRADVTKLVNGNGDYVVALFPGATSSTNGSNPWGATAPTTGPLAEGASLVVIYHSSAEPMGTVLLYDQGLAGTQFNVGGLSYSLAGVPTIPGVSSSIFTELAADGQIGAGVTAVSGTSGKITTLNSTMIAGPGSVVNDSDWDGTDGVPLNQLWDTHSHDVTGDLVSGTNTVTISSTNDCVVAISNALTVR